MIAKDTFFYPKSTINCNGKLVDITPAVMGILNITPDSFYDGGVHRSVDQAVTQAESLLQQGATIIDVGGYSSRPGAAEISEEEESERVIPVIQALIKKHPNTIISIDTFRSNVAQKAVDAGASIINDISAGELDKNMFQLVADRQVPYIMMHMKGTPKTMQDDPQYDNLLNEITQYFNTKIKTLRGLGVHDIIIDPGFGFGKTVNQNFELLKRMSELSCLEVPILAGISRKSMIWKTLNTSPKEALNGTTVLNTVALQNKAQILRVHDPKEALETIQLTRLVS